MCYSNVSGQSSMNSSYTKQTEKAIELSFLGRDLIYQTTNVVYTYTSCS